MKNIFLTLSFGIIFTCSTYGQADSLAVVGEVDSLIQLNRALVGQQKFDEALNILETAEKKAETAFGKESAAYATCVFNRGRTYYFMKETPKAEQFYLEALKIREKALGKEHPNYAWNLKVLADLYFDMSHYAKAEQLYLEAIAILEKVLGKEHPNYAASLNSLASFYTIMSNFAKAEPLHLEAKNIWKKLLGKEHPNYAASLNNLADLYYRMGEYAKAESLHLETKAIVEKVSGKEHPDYAESLNNLAAVYSITGKYEKAELLYLEVLTIREKSLGKDHHMYAMCLNNLAFIYFEMSDYVKAEPLYIEAITLLKKALGKEHPDIALNLNNLANLYCILGKYEKAELLYLEAKNIDEKTLGKEHPGYAMTLGNLANLFRNIGEYAKAESLHLEAKAIREKVLGKEHPHYAASLNGLAVLYSSMSQYDKAGQFFLELSAQNQALLEKSARHLSERELGSYISKFSESQNQTLAFTQRSGSEKGTAACYNNSLFYKGFLLQTTGQIKRLALSDSVAAERFNLLRSYHRRLAGLYAQPIAERDSTLVAELEEKADMAEKDLAKTVAGYAQAIQQVNWQEVQVSLKPAEAAIEFVHYRFTFPKETDSVLYAALLVKPGLKTPLFIPLFEEKQLDSLFRAFGPRKATYANALYGAFASPGDASGLSATLYQLVWQPLVKALEGVKTIYYAPSGLLHRLNIGAIPLGKDAVIADRFRLVQLGSTRQLVVPEPASASDNAVAMLFGGIRYEMDSTAISQANKSIPATEDGSRGETSFAQSDSTLRGGIWNYLKRTDVEADSLASMLRRAGIRSEVKKGYAATEEAFKQMGKKAPSPRILHIATHGFFFPDPRTEQRGNQEPVFKISDNPMIRSGLILAGANHAWKTGRPLANMEDGILTAYEISQLDLRHTDLVVLSACETGLGDIAGNEGVYGLQRAFKIAGAKHLVMSLWQVPDYQTQELMTIFYKKMLSEKMPVREALQAAQKEMRQQNYEPYYWAGFVLIE